MLLLGRYALLCALLTLGQALYAQFGMPQVLSNSGPTMVKAIDMDMDGDLDLVGVFNDHYVKWQANTNGTGFFAPAVTIVGFGQDIALITYADADNDGDTDILLCLEGSATIKMVRNEGLGSFSSPFVIADAGSVPAALATGEVNGDGFLDVVVTLGPNDGAGFAWFAGNGTDFDPIVTQLDLHAGPASTLLQVGDVDLSGGSDIVLRGQDNELILARNDAGNGSSWSVAPIPIPAGPPSYPYTTPTLLDVDADGDLDLAESGGSAVHWMRNDLDEDGALTFVEHLIEPWTSSGNGIFRSSPCSAGAAVFYTPGNPQLPVRWNSFVPELGDFPYSSDLNDIPRGEAVELADLNGDGKEDLVMVFPSAFVWYPNALPTTPMSLSMPVLDTLCLAGPTVTLPQAEPSGGAWYGEQVFDDQFFRANLFTAGAYPLTHVVYEPAGCPLAAQASIRLIEAPVITTTIPSVLCSSDSVIPLFSDPVDVQWYGTDGSDILDPALFGGGFVRCEYTDATGRTCSDLEGPIQRLNALPAEIEVIGPFCDGDPVQTITATQFPPLNGTWLGDITGSMGNTAEFDPSIGPGEYEVILVAEPFGPNQCANSDTLRITVSPRPQIAFTPLPAYCASGGPITLSGATPEGGFWSGTGISGGVLDPTALGAGVFPVNYFVGTPEGCGRQAVTTIVLVDSIGLSWSEDLLFCAADEASTVTATPVGGTWSGAVDASGTFDPGLYKVGSYSAQYTYTDPLGCSLTHDALQFIVQPASVVTIDSVGVLCLNDRNVQLVGNLSGTWSGALDAEGDTVVFDPQQFGIGTWTVFLTATGPGSCPGRARADILVDLCTGISGTSSTAPSLAPNPFTDELRINWNGDRPFLISVLDATGRALAGYHQQLTNSGAIDLGGLAAGTYFIRAERGTEVWNMRALKVAQ